jgi:hypothetical protein
MSVVAAVCHGPAALVGVTLSSGRPLVEGKSLAAFTDAEEAAAGLADVVPFLLQSRLEQLGAKHTGASVFQPHVVVDQRLVTGQNPASATDTARAVVAELERSRPGSRLRRGSRCGLGRRRRAESRSGGTRAGALSPRADGGSPHTGSRRRQPGRCSHHVRGQESQSARHHAGHHHPRPAVGNRPGGLRRPGLGRRRGDQRGTPATTHGWGPGQRAGGVNAWSRRRRREAGRPGRDSG